MKRDLTRVSVTQRTKHMSVFFVIISRQPAICHEEWRRNAPINKTTASVSVPFLFFPPLPSPVPFPFFFFHCSLTLLFPLRTRFSLGRSQGRHVAIVRDVDAIATYEYPRLGIIVCSADSDRRTEATRQPYNDAGKSNIRVVHVPSLLCIMNPISRISATDRNLWSVSTCNSASSASFSSANSDELFAGSVASPTRHVKNLIFLSSMRRNRRVGQPGNPRPRIIPRRIQERNGIRYSVSRAAMLLPDGDLIFLSYQGCPLTTNFEKRSLAFRIMLNANIRSAPSTDRRNFRFIFPSRSPYRCLL